MKFRIWTILWVFALLASAMATFGELGILFAISVGIVWGMVLSPHWKGTVVEWFVVIAILIVIIGLMLPPIQTGSSSARRTHCLYNLKQLGSALHCHHEREGQFPPAISSNEQGQPLLSWRYQVLPYLEQQTLYDRILRDEPWDSLRNKPKSNTDIDCLQCPSSDGNVNYFAVVGPQTAWPDSRGIALEEITDNPAHTLILIEAGDRNTSWLEPSDLSVEEAIDLLTNHVHGKDCDCHWTNNGFFYHNSRVRHVLMADGSVHPLSGSISPELATALLTINGGEEIDMNELDQSLRPQLNYSRIYSLTVFVLLSLLPVVKLWRRRATKS